MIKRRIKTLKIKDVKHLAMHLGTTPKELRKICDIIDNSPSNYYIQWEKKFKNGKIRPMVDIRGRLRNVLDRLNYLLQKIALPEYIHGGVPNKSTRTNAMPHTDKDMILCMDIEKHFPRVSPKKVYDMFSKYQECSPEVARILTRLTTLNGGLPQGSPTSTSISNLVTLNLSKRLNGFAKVRGIKCTQYVDDYTFSGRTKIEQLKHQIAKIIEQEGFKVNLSKTKSVESSREQIVTGIRVNGPQIDVPKLYLKKVRSEIKSLKQNASQERHNALYTKEMKSLEGKINYVSQFNPGAAKYLRKQLQHIVRDLRVCHN